MTDDTFAQLLASDHAPDIRVIAMPADTNPAGDIFGGWLMSQMDLAAGNAAARRARGRCATVAVEGIAFHSPVHVGDEISVYADLAEVGRTSMKFKVEAWRRSRDGDAEVKPGFKWSSQHLERGGCDDRSEAAFGSVRARRLVLARTALCCAA